MSAVAIATGLVALVFAALVYLVPVIALFVGGVLAVWAGLWLVSGLQTPAAGLFTAMFALPLIAGGLAMVVVAGALQAILARLDNAPHATASEIVRLSRRQRDAEQTNREARP